MKRTTAFIICLMIIFSAFSCAKPGKDDGTASTAESVPQPVPGRFGTIGFYAFDDVTDAKCKFWTACGIDTIELLDVGWYFRAGQPLESRNLTMRGWIAKAHKYGLKVVVILLTNLEQWTGEATVGNGSGKEFDPQDEEKMNERLGYIEKQVEAFSAADGFSLFAGDPGGVGGITVNRPKGDVQYYLDMVVKVREIVREKAPDAFFNANIWAVSQWERATYNPFNFVFWRAEDENGKKIIEMGDLINSDIGIEIPGHDYYRPLALRLYSQYKQYPDEPFPSKRYTDTAKANGTERIWGFSHFLLDELDDVDAERGSDRLGITTRYLKKYVDSMDAAGMNGLIAGQCRIENYLNLYAFARFSQDSSLTPEDVLREYASYLVPAEQVDTLTEIFKVLENDSNWHRKMPEEFREPDFEVRYGSASEALEDARKLTPLKKSPFDLPESPSAYLARVIQRLWAIVPPEETAENLPDGTVRVESFNGSEAGTTPVSFPAMENGAGSVIIGEPGYSVVYRSYSGNPLNLKDARESDAEISLWIYTDKPQQYAGYIQFADDMSCMSVEKTWMLDMRTALQTGWNRIVMKLSEGREINSDVSDWSKIGAWRIVLFGSPGDVIYLDNFDVVTNQSK